MCDDARRGCGGILCDQCKNWICGFSAKLSLVPLVVAELIGIIQDLNICLQLGLYHVDVLFDCIEAINLIVRGCDKHYPFLEIIEEVRAFFLREKVTLLLTMYIMI